MSTRIHKPGKAPARPRPKSRAALFATAAAVLGAVAIAIWAGGKALIPGDTSAPTEQTSESPPQAVPPEPQAAGTEPEAKLFSGSMLTADREEPEKAPEPDHDEENRSIPFKLEQVADALSHVELDESGNIVMNEAALTILEQAFLDARTTLDEEQLAELKTMIKAGLGGQAGEQAVQITDRFYRYSNAFREISDTLAVRRDLPSLRNDYEQIARLRRTHLGPELADKLYAREEQMTRYTLKVMAIQADPDLTPEQRTEKQQELASRYPEAMPGGGEPDRDQSAEQATN